MMHDDIVMDTLVDKVEQRLIKEMADRLLDTAMSKMDDDRSDIITDIILALVTEQMDDKLRARLRNSAAAK